MSMSSVKLNATLSPRPVEHQLGKLPCAVATGAVTATFAAAVKSSVPQWQAG